MYHNNKDDNCVNPVVRPISVEELNLCVKHIMKTSRRLEGISLTHLRIVFSIVMLILKSCNEIQSLLKSMNDEEHRETVFFNDVIHVAIEVYCVLEKKYELKANQSQ
jgi:hypothetical protein